MRSAISLTGLSLLCVVAASASEMPRTHLEEALKLRVETRTAEAERLLRADLSTHPAGERRAELLYWLGVVQKEAGELGKAEISLRNAEECYRTSEKPSAAVRPLSALVELYLETNRGRAAEGALDRASGLPVGPGSPEYLELLRSRALLACARQRFDTAESLLREIVLEQERRSGPSSYSVAAALNNLAVVLLKRRDYARSVPVLQRADSILTAVAPGRHQDLIRTRLNLAGALLEIGELSSADEMSADQVKSIAQYLGSGHPDMAHALFLRSQVLARLGRNSEAKAARNRSADLMWSFQARTVDRSELLAGR